MSTMEISDKKEREIAEEYLSSLVDLNVNSKPLINMLTILAEENIEHGQVIVNAVEQHITKIEPDVKLPVLYLIDSIVKNVGREYITLFSHSIVNIFCGVFEKVNEKIRHKMFSLRQTWSDVFPPQKLYTLDIKVNRMDPGWPITQKVPNKTPAIHVNPNFFKSKTENEMQAQLQLKQRQLLELKKRKLELELAATQKQLSQTNTTEAVSGGLDPSLLPEDPLIKPETTPVPAITMEFPIQTNQNLPPPVVPQPNVRKRIPPVNPALVSSVCLRDPRLMRQTQSTQQQQSSHLQPQQPDQIVKHHQIPLPQINTFEPQNQRVPSHFQNNNNNNNNNTNRNRMQQQRYASANTLSYNDSNKTQSDSLINSDNSKNVRKDSKLRSSTSQKSSSKSISKPSGNKSTSRSSGAKPSSTRSPSKPNLSHRSSSSSSSSKDQKDRRDDSKLSPQRKKARRRSVSPSRRSHSPKENSKSPRKSNSSESKTSPKSDSKYSKDSSKTSPYKNRTSNSRERSKSPSQSTRKSSPNGSIPKDVDLRVLPSVMLNTKALAASTPSVVETTVAKIANRRKSLNAELILKASVNEKISSITKNEADTSKAESHEKKNNKVATKDIDLRVGMLPGIVSSRDGKKRLSEERSVDEPKTKKSKSGKIDVLFGTEDVDLRTLAPGIGSMAIAAPPPPRISTGNTATADTEGWNKMKGDTPKKSSVQHKPSLDAVRAKLAEATKNTSISNKSRNRDIDLRPKIDFIDENSQETDEKFKLIMAQAQEQVENKNMDKEQFLQFKQQVIELKKDADARKTHKRIIPHNKKPGTFSSEENEAFSSGSDNETLKKSHRVPSKHHGSSRSPSSKRSADTNKGTRYSATNDLNRPKTKDAVTTASKERRQRKTKWSPWEEPQKPANANLPLQSGTTAGNMVQPAPMQGFTIPMVPNMPMSTHIWQQNPTPFTDSQNLQSMSMIPSVTNPLMNPQVNIINSQQLIMAQHGSSITSIGINERTINIDNIPREIRFYEEIAIAFMQDNGREPKEIGFQSGERRITVDNKESIVLAFNDSYKPFVIDGKQYQIRFGSPTRELYIDNEWYECYFGDPPVGVALDNKLHVFKVEGPAPQVRIGSLRNDLVVGKVDMYIDVTTIVSLFLDSQAQTFFINNQMHTIQFADYLLTVLIDTIPFPVQYGAMPTKYQLPSGDHYIRFSILPNDIMAGKVFIRDMVRTNAHRDLLSPPPVSIADVLPKSMSIPPVTGPILPLMSIVPNPDLLLSSKLASAENQASALMAETNNPLPSTTAPPTTATSALGTMNINDLFQKLLDSGILNKTTEAATVKEKEKFTPVLLSNPETLKKRQPAIIHALFSGMQCSSCGVRFPPEQTMKYSQHLDWHYRQNRRERESARRAHSRKWYYDVSDWTQYEEIENLEEREKNWFETQQNEMDSTNDESNQRTNSPLPSCVAGLDEHDKACEMCHDQFETFFSEETEEWHLRSAVRVDGHTYHPICYEDYKASLALEESNLNASAAGGDISADDNAVDLPIKFEKYDSNANTDNEITLDDDDDVIVIPQEEPVITEIPDDDDEEGKNQKAEESEKDNAEIDASLVANPEENAKEDEENDTSINNESDVQILEPQISVMDLDEIEDLPEDTVPVTNEGDAANPLTVKIKAEPKYEGYADENEDDAFEDVGTFEGEAIGLIDDGTTDEYVSMAVVSAPKSQATIDGNIELQDASATAIGTNKIKINITKNVQLNKNAINNSENSDNNLTISGNDKLLASSSVNNENLNKNQIEDADEASIEPEYVLKDSMKSVIFKRQPVVKNGLETSGLCSIM